MSAGGGAQPPQGLPQAFQPRPQQQAGQPGQAAMPGLFGMAGLPYTQMVPQRYAQQAQPQQAAQQQRPLGVVGQAYQPVGRPLMHSSVMPTAGVRPAVRPLIHQMVASQLQATAQPRPAAKQVAKKRKDAPGQAVERLPESAQLTSLQELDEQLVASLKRQRQELHGLLRHEEHVRKRLRVYVQSSCRCQDAPADGPEPPQWTLKLWGRVLEGATLVSGREADARTGPKHTARPLSAYVARLSVSLAGTEEQLPRGAGPQQLEWRQEAHSGEHLDHFLIQRPGRPGAKAVLQLELDSQPPLWALSDGLAALLGRRAASQPEAIHAILDYAVRHKLRERGSDEIRCAGTPLEQLLQGPSLPARSLAERLQPHMSRLPPYRLEHTVSLGGARECYDLELCVPTDAADQQTLPAIDRLLQDPEAERLQAQVSSLVRQARERLRRRDFLLAFGAAPGDFFRGLAACHARELRGGQDLAGQGQAPVKSERRTQFFRSRWVEDAVLRYLHRRLAAGGG